MPISNSLSLRSYRRGLRIGLFGGSFHPAHAGHAAVSLEARKQLKLHQVWWVVAAGNPLKSPRGMAPFSERLASARAMAARHPALRVTEVEQSHGLRYTYDTVTLLKRMAPGLDFVWIMGRDNLDSFPKWRRWRELARMLPIAVLDRGPGHAYPSLRSRAAQALGSRLRFIRLRRHPLSSTALRKGLAA